MIELLRQSEFDKVYEIMEESFPPDEHRPLMEQKVLLNNSNYSICVAKDGKED